MNPLAFAPPYTLAGLVGLKDFRLLEEKASLLGLRPRDLQDYLNDKTRMLAERRYEALCALRDSE